MTSTTTKSTDKKPAWQNGEALKPTSRDFSYNIRNYVNYTRFLIVTITLLFTLGGAYYAFFLTPKYQATVLLSSKIYGSLSASSLSTDKILPVDDKETSAPRQLVLIQTQSVLTKLVEQLHLDITITPNTPSVESNSISLKRLVVPPTIVNKEILLATTTQQTYSITIPDIEFSKNASFGMEDKFLLPDGSSMEIRMDNISAPIGSLFTIIKAPQGETINNLIDNLVFDAPGMDNKLVTNVITIAYTGMEPIKITDTVNALADIVVEMSKDQERSEATYMTQLMEIEKNFLLDLLNAKGQELAAASMGLDRVAYDERVYGKLYTDELSQINNNIALAHSELAKLSQSVTSKNRLYLEAQAAYRSLVDQRDSITKKIDRSVSGGNLILDLQRDLAAYTTLYQTVVANLEQFRARMIEPIGNLRVVEYACIPDTPSSLPRLLIVLLSIIVGMISGYVVALVFD